MTTGGRRVPLLTVGLALALSGCAGTDATSAPASTSANVATPSSPAGQRIEVAVAGGEVLGDTGRVPVAVGGPVTLVVSSDVADEIHLHGYDLTTALEPGTPTELSFDATVPGVFEVELHEAGTVLLTLQVG